MQCERGGCGALPVTRGAGVNRAEGSLAAIGLCCAECHARSPLVGVKGCYQATKLRAVEGGFECFLASDASAVVEHTKKWVSRATAACMVEG